MTIAPPLNVGWGYGIVLGLGAAFAFGMVGQLSPHLFFNAIVISNNQIRFSSRGSSSGTIMSCKRPKCSVRREEP